MADIQKGATITQMKILARPKAAAKNIQTSEGTERRKHMVFLCGSRWFYLLSFASRTLLKKHDVADLQYRTKLARYKIVTQSYNRRMMLASESI